MPKTASANITEVIRIYLPSFPLNFRSCIFRESRGILVTIRRETVIRNIASAAVDPANDSINLLSEY